LREELNVSFPLGFHSNWSFGETFYTALRYRVLDTDYEAGSGASIFRYDVTLSGPALGIGWRFG